MYELLVIGSPKADSEQVLALVDKALKGADAKDIKIDKLGRKNLAFPISKQTEGEYMVFNFEAEGEKVAQIDGKLRREQEAILRYFIIKPKVSKVKEKVVTAESTEVKTATTEDSEEKSVAKIEVKADTKEAKVSKGTKVTLRDSAQAKVTKVKKAKKRE